MEEVKHLFDVEGVAFVLGMHGEALAHSVSAAYGSQFDGAAYLLRFITRRYTLRSVEVEPLLAALISARGLDTRRLVAPSVQIREGERASRVQLHTLLSMYFTAFDMNARSAFAVVDVLETCLAITGDIQLHIPYLMPLVCNFVRGRKYLARSVNFPSWNFAFYNSEIRQYYYKNLNEVADDYDEALKLSIVKLREAYDVSHQGSVIMTVAEYELDGLADGSVGHPRSYEKLLRLVAHFK